MLQVELNGKWKMKQTDKATWIDARVPGSVYSDLLTAGQMEDPFYRENEYDALEISKNDFEYFREFQVNSLVLAHDRVVLCCEGLDTICDIFINGNKILEACNMHRTYEISIKNIIFNGVNTIRAVFHSPVRYCLEKQQKNPLINVDDAIPGISHLRKAHCMFGWDWGPKLPDMGIWRNIFIRCFNTARIDDVHITQKHTTSMVELDTKTKLRNRVFRYRLEKSTEAFSTGTVLFVKSKHFNFKDPHINTVISETSDRFLIDVTVASFAKFIELDIKNVDAVFCDNYFDLTTTEPRRIELLKSDISKKLSLKELKTKLATRSLYDTYID